MASQGSLRGSCVHESTIFDVAKNIPRLFDEQSISALNLHVSKLSEGMK